LVIAVLSVPAGAQAATRYAAPNGGAAFGCPALNPCAIEVAINGAGNGDEVIIGSGDYHAGAPWSSEIMNSSTSLNVHGVDGQPRPRLFSSSATYGLNFDGAGSSVRRLGIVESNASGQGALRLFGSSAEYVVIEAGGSGRACEVVQAGTPPSTTPSSVRNSICHASSGQAVHTLGGATLRGVSAWSDSGLGVFAEGQSGEQVTLSNTIAHGSTNVAAGPFMANGLVNVVADHSNYATTFAAAGSSVTPAGSGTNQNAAPQLTAPGGGDFHQLAASPTIDRGGFGDIGTFDVYDHPRVLGAAPDIGADEFVPLPGGGGGGGGAGGGGGGGPTATAAVSKLGVSPTTFPAAPSGPSAQATRRARRRTFGTKVSYTLNQPASVRFTVQQTQPGRKTGKGKKTRCVPQTKNNRKAKKCTRVVTLPGSFTLTGRAGANSFRFTGRLAGKKLKPGNYTLVGTPTANGKTGQAVTTAFRIIP
jgi:hypothetical protein